MPLLLRFDLISCRRNNGNYILASNSVSGAVGQIDAKALTVTADNKTITFGNSIPPLTYTYAGLISGDVFTGALATRATSSTNAGTYAIARGSLTAGSNYALSYNAGTLTIQSGAGVTPSGAFSINMLPSSVVAVMDQRATSSWSTSIETLNPLLSVTGTMNLGRPFLTSGIIDSSLSPASGVSDDMPRFKNEKESYMWVNPCQGQRFIDGSFSEGRCE
jgi:hypothetical protein